MCVPRFHQIPAWARCVRRYCTNCGCAVWWNCAGFDKMLTRIPLGRWIWGTIITYILNALWFCTNLQVQGTDGYTKLPGAILDLIGTYHTFELKSHTYFEHGTYESFTCWKINSPPPAGEITSSSGLEPDTGSSSPLMKKLSKKSLSKNPNVSTPLKPVEGKNKKRYHTVFQIWNWYIKVPYDWYFTCCAVIVVWSLKIQTWSQKMVKKLGSKMDLLLRKQSEESNNVVNRYILILYIRQIQLLNRKLKTRILKTKTLLPRYGYNMFYL